MATATIKRPKFDNLAELMERLGGVPLERIRMQPPPGTAKEKDVLAAERKPRKRLCELIDGVLVEKAMGIRESILAAFLSHLINDFLDENPRGIVLGADGMIRTFPGQVRIPDVSFISWDRYPAEQVPDEGISSFAPNLAVEVLSPSNTKAEIDRKLRDYFAAGVELTWVIDPKTQTAKAYTSPEDVQPIGKTGSLDGGGVLPGFRLPLKQLFACLRRSRGR
ncbi:MAG TPA: Uma2 family endonuclease [Gemmataceae bacterium]|jgi:Uma2 family endonuclease